MISIAGGVRAPFVWSSQSKAIYVLITTSLTDPSYCQLVSAAEQLASFKKKKKSEALLTMFGELQDSPNMLQPYHGTRIASPSHR